MPDTAWSDALLAIRLLAREGAALGGVHLRARHGPVREEWLARLGEAFEGASRRVPATVPESRMRGGLDLAASLATQRPVAECGIVAGCDGRVLVLGCAERVGTAASAVLVEALDTGEVRVESGVSAKHRARIVLVALDEGAEPDERLPDALSDRLALHIDLSSVTLTEAQCWFPEPARQEGKAVLDDEMLAAITATAARLSSSLRRPVQVARLARALAELAGADRVEAEHAAHALRLSFGTLPPAPEAAEEQVCEPEAAEPQDAPEEAAEPSRQQALEEMLVEAQRALRPDLSRLAPEPSRRGPVSEGGRGGARRRGSRRGAPCGLTARAAEPGARPDVLGTLMAAAPWQKVRRMRRSDGPPLRIEAGDLRWRRRRDHVESVTVFVVDASGSTAVTRLAEAKGAIELLLADAYVSREHVALVAFRGEAAQTLLEPTRSLTRAKRALGALPGGGPTPLASAMEAARGIGEAERIRGRAPLLVMMTDGSGNVALDGTPGRAQASEDEAQAARRLVASGLRTVVVDISPRRSAGKAKGLAERLHAEWRPLPRADAVALSDLVAQTR